jgi:glycosyltransferase involved in cell wall biosynthesis
MDVNNLKIAFVTADCSTQGTYFRWHNIAMGLVNLGHTVTVYCIDNDDIPVARTESRNGVVYRIAKSAKGKSLFGTTNHPITAVKRIFDDFSDCDIVHAFQPFLTVYLPWKFNFRKKAKITFFDWDDLWVDKLRDKNKKNFRGNWEYKLNGYFERKIASLGYRMTVCSNFLKNKAIERGASQVDIIHNGFWKYDVPEKALAREKLGLQKDVSYVGFMGRTGFELYWAFNALDVCLKKGFNIRLALCGPNADVMGGLSDSVRSNIDYLGSLSPDDTRYFAAAIDLGLLPLMRTEFNESRFPIKFAEYLAAGLPVLCSEVGEVNEYGKKYPWVIKAGGSEEEWINHFVEAVQLLIENGLVSVDQSVVFTDLSWSGISKQVEGVYLTAMENVTQ